MKILNTIIRNTTTLGLALLLSTMWVNEYWNYKETVIMLSLVAAIATAYRLHRRIDAVFGFIIIAVVPWLTFRMDIHGVWFNIMFAAIPIAFIYFVGSKITHTLNKEIRRINGYYMGLDTKTADYMSRNTHTLDPGMVNRCELLLLVAIFHRNPEAVNEATILCKGKEPALKKISNAYLLSIGEISKTIEGNLTTRSYEYSNCYRSVINYIRDESFGVYSGKGGLMDAAKRYPQLNILINRIMTKNRIRDAELDKLLKPGYNAYSGIPASRVQMLGARLHRDVVDSFEALMVNDDSEPMGENLFKRRKFDKKKFDKK